VQAKQEVSETQVKEREGRRITANDDKDIEQGEKD